MAHSALGRLGLERRNPASGPIVKVPTHLFHCTLMSIRFAVLRPASVALGALLLACGADATAPAPVDFIGITPAAAVLQIGATKQMTAIVRDVGGNNLTGRAVTWTSNNPAVATISASGLVKAMSPGYADILASSEGKTTGVGLTVATPE
jgi:hypothetical protein